MALITQEFPLNIYPSLHTHSLREELYKEFFGQQLLFSSSYAPVMHSIQVLPLKYAELPTVAGAVQHTFGLFAENTPPVHSHFPNELLTLFPS